MIKLLSLLTEAMSRGGTIVDSFYNIANNADEIEGDNDGKDTYPIEVKRLGASEDGKTNEEIVIRYGQEPNDYFSIYDYKFGEDPTSEENYQKEYDFSIGVPTGNKDAIRYAMKLGFKVKGMPKSNAERGEDKPSGDLLKKIENDLRGRFGDRYSDTEIQLFIDSVERDIKRGDYDGVETMYDNKDHYEDFEEYISDKRSNLEEADETISLKEVLD